MQKCLRASLAVVPAACAAVVIKDFFLDINFVTHGLRDPDDIDHIAHSYVLVDKLSHTIKHEVSKNESIIIW